jgi:recombination protein RecA
VAGPTIADAIKHLKKEVAHALEFDTKREAISTGSLALDRTIGIGGFPRGRISEIHGWESSGKTTISLSACAQAQRKNLYCAYIDPERGLDLMHAKRIGFNFEDEAKGLYITPFSMEETFLAVYKMAEAQVPLIIVDSVPAMIPEKILKGEIDDTSAGGGGGVGLNARLLAQFLARISKTIDDSNSALVFCNQMRARIAMDRWDFGPREQAAGGSALKFYTSLRVDVSRRKEIKEERPDPDTGALIETTIGNLHRAHIVKNKVAMPFRECEFLIKYDAQKNIYGIDNLQTVIDLALEKGLIESKGAGFFTVKADGQDYSCRGNSALYDFFLKPENVTVYKSVRGKLGI